MEHLRNLARGLFFEVMNRNADGVESGGGGADPGTSEQGAQEGEPPQDERPPEPKTFTQEEVNRMMGRARSEGRESALREAEAASAASRKTESTPSGESKKGDKQTEADRILEDLRAEREAIKAERFEAFRSRHEIPSEVADDLRSVYFSDPDKAARLAKLAKGSLVSDTENRTQEDGAPAPPAAAAGTSPRRVSHLEADGIIDVFSLSEEDIERMGLPKVVEHYERAVNEAKSRQGAPPLPKVLRNRS